MSPHSDMASKIRNRSFYALNRVWLPSDSGGRRSIYALKLLRDRDGMGVRDFIQ